MPTDVDYLRHIAADSARFRALLAGRAPAAEVPTCPGWDAAELLWHLAEVQSFWTRLVQQRCLAPHHLEGEGLVRPSGYDELLRVAERVSVDLVDALRTTPPQTPVWTWAEDQTVGFVLRRQAHEALIHRIDAECVAGERGPVDAALATDGADEALRVMFGGSPTGSELSIDESSTVRLRTTDTGHSWRVTLARFAITEPDGAEQGGPTLLVAADDYGLSTAATVSAAAADLDCWLWNRPAEGAVELTGDVHVLAGLRAVLADGIQ